MGCLQALQLLCTLYPEDLSWAAVFDKQTPQCLLVPHHWLEWSQHQMQKLLFTQPSAAKTGGFLSPCALQLQYISKGKTAIGFCTHQSGQCIINKRPSALCWFRRNWINIFHLFPVAELHRDPHLPPLLLIPWEALFVNTVQAGFALVPRPRKREKNNPKQLQSFHLRN